MADEKETAAAEAPKKSKKMLFIIVAAVVALGGGGGAFFMLKGSGSKAEAAPKKGIVTAIDSPITINLSDGHYLKLGFSLQQTADSGTEAVDTSEALNLAIDEYTGKSVADLTSDKGREEAKADFLTKVEKAYTKDGTKEVMDIYFTSFVTQ